MLSKEMIDQLRRGRQYQLGPQGVQDDVISAAKLLWPEDACAGGTNYYRGNGNSWSSSIKPRQGLTVVSALEVLAYFQQGETSFSTIQTTF